MHDEAILACLQRIETRLNSDEYEYSDPATIGGLQGNYQVSSPYNTECEWALISASSGGAGSFAIGSKNSALGAFGFDASSPSLGAVATGKDGNAFQGHVGNFATNNTYVTYDAVWMPLGGNSVVYLSTKISTNGLFCTVMFRRKLERAIPYPPTRKAHTHSTVQSRRGARTFTAGFEAQYPHDKYVHETLPETEDLPNLGNVEEMSPAQVLLAKMRNGGR